MLWKDNSTALQINKLGSLGRLKNSLQNLERNQEVLEMSNRKI